MTTAASSPGGYPQNEPEREEDRASPEPEEELINHPVNDRVASEVREFRREVTKRFAGGIAFQAGRKSSGWVFDWIVDMLTHHH